MTARMTRGSSRIGTAERGTSGVGFHRKGWFRRWCRPGAVVRMASCVLLASAEAQAGAQLAVSTAPPPAGNPPPITWNVIGLDSNTVNGGPNLLLVRARVCNTGDARQPRAAGVP